MFEQLLFILFSVAAIGSALAVVTMRNPVYCAVSLVVCLFQVAGLFMLLRSPFLAVVQVFIYVGAVMVLFLFAIMLLDMKQIRFERLFSARSWVPYAVLAGIAIEFLAVIYGGGIDALMRVSSTEAVEVKTFGKVLFTEYLLPFEVVSILLLVAMVGAIVMVKRSKG
ncbi:MAG TPA: NADH-quinone oxidoreductase subunit J [Deltaproteobacteria bacterium]|nr:NADH-quinone oxidoreductase subunit J [Deltaproteobacteria bacterium]